MAKKNVTQCDRIIRFLLDFKTITSAEAMTELGVYRLASRINDLKKQGYAIQRTMLTGKNRYGEPTHFAQYSLLEIDEKKVAQ